MQENDNVEMGDQPLDPNINNFPTMTPADQLSYVRYMMAVGKFDQFQQNFSSINQSQYYMRALFLQTAVERDPDEQKKNAAIAKWSPAQGGKKNRKSRRRKTLKKRKHSRKH